MTIRIENKIIGQNHPCFIIAEVSSNHGNDLERAKKLIDAAADAGADAVKFQVFTAEKIAADTDDPRTIVRANEKAVFVDVDTKLIDLYRPHELQREWLPVLAAYAQEKEILFMATPFDEEAVDQLEAVHVPAYKNGSYELLDVPLLRKMAKTKKPLILSTGMATLSEIKAAIEIVKKAGNDQVILLHCTSTYPTPFEDVNLHAMMTMMRAFPNCPVGLSDHSIGTSSAIGAAAIHACMIEKHLMLDDNVPTIDDQFSLEPSEFKAMVDGIRQVEKALGSFEKGPTEKEKKEKIQARRSLWITQDIKAGEPFNRKNIGVLRPGTGLTPLHYDLVMKSHASRDLKAVSALEMEDITPQAPFSHPQ
ncbi:MAG: pseudaminic acid synthase [Waddliaceae bacterium]